MSTVTGHIVATPAQVYSVLADGWMYSNWVVGTSHVRAVEESWPAVGSRLFHASGLWPVVTRDETVVDAAEPDVSLTITAKGWPLGEARVVIELKANDTGTTVSMTETPTAGPGRWLHNPVTDAVLRRRNDEALARLAAVVERHTRPAA